MVELSPLIKISLFLMLLNPVASIIIYFLPPWKRYVEKFDHMDDEDT